MNSRAHWLSAYVALSHLVIGLSELFHIGPRFLPPSWQIIYMALPEGWDWVYPGLWTVTGVVAMFGVRWPFALRIGFKMSSALFLVWGLAGIPAWTSGIGGNIQGIAANLFIAGCTIVLAHYVSIGLQADAVNVQVARLAEQVHQADGNHDGR